MAAEQSEEQAIMQAVMEAVKPAIMAVGEVENQPTVPDL